VSGRHARLAVCVSGEGTNLRSLAAACEAGRLPAQLAIVVADRSCPALEWAQDQGLPTAMLGGAGQDGAARDAELAETLAAAAPDVVVLAGFLSIVGTATLDAFAGRMVNVHPSLLPAFPGRHAIRDAINRGVRATGVTVHLVDDTVDGGPILLQEAVPVQADDDEASLLARIHPVEHRLLQQAVLLLLNGAIVPGASRGGNVRIDPAGAASAALSSRRALLSVSDKTGVTEFAAGLHERGFELVSTGGTAEAIRQAGLPVTDVAAVTGVPEMLDGRVKTLHPRIHGGLLADRRRPEHRAHLAAEAIGPFEVLAVNLYPFAQTAERRDTGLDQLTEEIDIGGPSLLRAAAKNFASVAVVCAADRYPAVLDALDRHGEIPVALRAALAIDAFRHVAAYDARIVAELPIRMAEALSLPDEPGLPGASDPFPTSLPVALEKVATLRYGENPHQAAALYRRPGGGGRGPFADGGSLLQGKELSYNNVLDASAAAGLARDLTGPACVVIKHTNPCGAAEADDLVTAWERALAGDPVSAFGGVVAVTGPVDRALAEHLTALFLEVVLAPAVDPDAAGILATKPNLRVLVDPGLGGDPDRGADQEIPIDPLGDIRTTGGGVLVAAPDLAADDPTGWRVATTRAPAPDEARDLDLAWRIARHVKSNAIVLVRDLALVGVGAGQMSRVDAARLALAKAGERAAGASCASDAFYPFPDAVEVCLEAGVEAFVQPGGSMRDPDVIAAAEAAGATMIVTGRRHFRH
jgi:phosphoribosylaminoimidazolecarboxamide formyltransferase / IMP cyclohydrolase